MHRALKYRELVPCKALMLAALWGTMCLTQSAHAVNETFTYDDGALEGQGLSAQWTGPWAGGPQSPPPTGSDPWQIQSGAVNVVPVNSTIPYGYEDSDIQRTLTTPETGTSVYMSMLITPGNMGTTYDPNLFSDGSTGIVVGFADSDLNIGNNAPMITTFRFYEGFTGLYTDGFAISLNGVFSSSNTMIGNWIEGQTYRLVGRLTFEAQGSKEKWSVWIDPISEADPAAGSVTNNLGYSQIGMTRLYEYVDNFTAVSSSMIDDLRIGATWDSVTGPIPDPIDGDLNSDGFVGLDDLDIILSNWNQTVPPGNPLADPSGDGFVGLDDLDIVLNNWNSGTPPTSASVPEPSAMMLLSTLGLAYISRRKCRSRA